jgi:hypothetical protein
VHQHLLGGVSSQLEAFTKGFNDVFPMENVSIFSVDELETFLGGAEDSSWDLQSK